MIVCLCRGRSENDVQQAIDAGATSLRDLMRCGMGDQCGSCHNMLRAMLARSAAAHAAEAQPCAVCAGEAVAAG